MTSKIVLHREMEEFVERMVATGRYEHASDVVWAGLELLKDQEVARAARQADLVAKIEEGLASAERGELIDAEEVFAELERLFDEKSGGSKDAA